MNTPIRLHLGTAILLSAVAGFTAQAQTPGIDSVTNAASFMRNPGVSAGSLVSVFGNGFALGNSIAGSIPLPTTLGDTSVTFNDIPAPMLFASPRQLNVQVPWNVLRTGVRGTATVVVRRGGSPVTASFVVPIVPSAPGIFAIQAGFGRGIVINPDGSLAATAGAIGGFKSAPAAYNTTLVILATGLGQVDAAIENGRASNDRLRRTTAVPTVLIGGRPVKVLFSGLSPEFVGVNQLNVVVSPSIEPGTSLPIQIQMGEFTSTDRVTIAVRSPFPGEAEVPTILPPQPESRTRLTLRPDALPRAAKAQFPTYDGDPFFVSLPVQQQQTVPAGQIAQTVVDPILSAIGFDRGLKGVRLPPTNGVDQPRADFAGLARALNYEYANNPKLFRPETREMLTAFLEGKGDASIDKALDTGEGMTLAQYIAGIQRLAIEYPFVQVDGDVVIEHSGIYPVRWEGQGITSIRGSLINRYSVANRRIIKPEDAFDIAITALARVDGISRITCKAPQDGPTLILLQYGSDGAGIIQLRYSYRMILSAMALGNDGYFQLWLDADNGQILKLIPVGLDVNSSGAVYNRDPGNGTTTNSFQVDTSSAGQYTLKLAGVMNRVDYAEDGFNALDVSISDAGGGSSATFANFDQAPINVAAQALCGAGTNKGFQQVNFFSMLHRYYTNSLALSIYTPFPKLGGTSADASVPWNPRVEVAGYCNANASMRYGACTGYFDAACPNFTDGTFGGNNFMNFAHDNTVVGHELAHSITPRFTSARPSDWCGMGPCAVPVGWSAFHDLADFWADHFEGTNCTAGWVAKNLGGVDQSRYCSPSNNEGGGLPRWHIVTTPFNAAAPGDHFPEHRSAATGDYAEGQMGAAALWQVRVGMRSKCRPSGIPQFGVRWARALKDTGFFGIAPPSTDLGLFRYLYDLERAFTDQWATSGSPMGPPAFAHNGPHTTSKVTGGFARTGLFLVPYQCIDGDAGTSDPGFCPTGDNGGDAVIDIDDNVPGDDLVVGNVPGSQPEVDFLLLGGPAPTFHVWTGPRYQFGGTGAASFPNPALCNTKFRVEVSTDMTFPAGSTIMSLFTNVGTDPATPATQCYGTWTPSAADWTTLQAGGAGTRIYYRARTRNAADLNERLSTMPGNGLWTVPPPYAVITADGQSDY